MSWDSIGFSFIRNASMAAGQFDCNHGSGAVRSSAGIGFSQQVRVHDPAMLQPSALAHRLDLVFDVGELAGQQDFVFGSEIGAPEDVEVRFGQTRKGLRAVEQHDNAAEFARKAVGELASSGEQHTFSDPIEGDAMFRRQNLHAADPWDDLKLQREPFGAHAFEDPQRAVVDRGIAPHQDAADLVFLKLVLELAAKDVGEIAMTLVDGGEIVAGGRPLRNIDVDGAVVRFLDEALADRGSQITQGGLLVPLVGNEKDIDLIERLDRLDRHVIGIANADANHEDLSHLSLRVAALVHPRKRFQLLTQTTRQPPASRSIRVSDKGAIEKRSAGSGPISSAMASPARTVPECTTSTMSPGGSAAK